MVINHVIPVVGARPPSSSLAAPSPPNPTNQHNLLPSLKLTAKAPENRWLEDKMDFLSMDGLFFNFRGHCTICPGNNLDSAFFEKPSPTIVLFKETTMAQVWDKKSSPIKSVGDLYLPVLPSLKLTASLPLKMDGWNICVSFWGPAYFQGRFAVSFRECNRWWRFNLV